MSLAILDGAGKGADTSRNATNFLGKGPAGGLPTQGTAVELSQVFLYHPYIGNHILAPEYLPGHLTDFHLLTPQQHQMYLPYHAFQQYPAPHPDSDRIAHQYPYPAELGPPYQMTTLNPVSPQLSDTTTSDFHGITDNMKPSGGKALVKSKTPNISTRKGFEGHVTRVGSGGRAATRGSKAM
ncbi:hypothetical protein R3P38DRAFT_3293758 [Favolaschia claudopus]|uniref:Uncharacterized protein n=1 Tax=Favolaschia claudopus TaxID=2862362 RepID=A0AAV9ZG60_9AGAR